MRHVLVLVEGQTEERFVKDVLGPEFWPRGLSLIPKIVVTKRTKCGPDFKGGIVSYRQVEGDLRRLLGDTSAAAVTTFIDYYNLPSDFPGIATRPEGSAQHRVRHVEEHWERNVNHPRFRAYLALHEFEAFLFVSPEALCEALYQQEKLPLLQAIRDGHPTPEEINEGRETAPSKRIAKILPAYQKPLDGPNVARRIGLRRLREECSHFNDWVTWLERLQS